jgi:hypothetical protein
LTDLCDSLSHNSDIVEDESEDKPIKVTDDILTTIEEPKLKPITYTYTTTISPEMQTLWQQDKSLCKVTMTTDQ